MDRQPSGNGLYAGLLGVAEGKLSRRDAKSTARLLLPKDYLRYEFTGEIGSEPSDASSTLLFDTANRQWCLHLLEKLEISPALLPPIHESAQVAGGLSRSIAGATGLIPGTPVLFGDSDQACQAIGHGVIDSTVISSTIGTGGQLFAPLSLPRFDPQLHRCESCGFKARLFHWHCPACGARAKPKPGACCVFCSYGSVPCPPVQRSRGCCG